MKTITYDALEVRTHASREALGEAAAVVAAETIREACDLRGEARVIFACALSQDEFLAALVRQSVAWNQVTIFHMDEYVGLRATHPQSIRHFLRAHLLDHIARPRAVHLIQGEKDPVHECARYGKLLAERPIDFVCMGIGENGHLAFNDPPVADFNDPQLVKIVELDEKCRRQQVHDGCFPEIEAVPAHAITLTIPALVGARHISCCVPGTRKANAVHDTLLGPITRECPASILRRHANAVLHIDPASATHLEE
ncbi:glucosamine-6-phosphate deaminase [Chthoniobacter flavus]|nr:glucosamine-6-phosphate deaminase [Chthoniobacter flavus]TCO90385.1 glucosamine-6-phosphate deaminase [Chthoniobacter flavus]